jgi:Imelysin
MEDNFPAGLAASMRYIPVSVPGLLLVLLLAGCQERDEKGPEGNYALDAIDQALMTKTVKRIEEAGSTHSRRSMISIETLQVSIAEFLDTPDLIHQRQMQDHWYKAHSAFLAASFFSFNDESQFIFQIDAWPIQEGFLDSLPDYPQSGIINDLALVLTEGAIRAQHGITDVQEVSLGFHALEFLIFSRSLDEFSIPSDEIKARRRKTLGLISKLLGQDIHLMFGESRADGNAHISLDGADMSAPLKRVLLGLHTRMQLLFDETNSLASENAGHSRFSHSSWSNLDTQIKVLDELTGKQTEINRIFTLLDEKTANDYRLTLGQTGAILATDKPDEEKLTRITLLIAALGHQLGDFIIALDNDTR